jgi:hypothetical protein
MRGLVAALVLGCLGAFAAVAAADNPSQATTTGTTATTVPTIPEPVPLTLQLVKPKQAVITRKRFTIVVRATGPADEPISIKLTADQGHGQPITRTGPSGSFSFPERASQGGVYRFTADATAGSLTAHLPLSFTVEPPLTAIQAWENGRGASIIAPGCSTCVITDPRGDTHRGPPDIKSVKSTYRKGWVTITIVSYDTVSAAHGRHPCVGAWTVPRTATRNHWFGFGCQEGPHLGKIWAQSCPHADAYGDCGSAHESFPNSHTTRYRFRPSQLGKIAAFYWQTLVEVSDNDIRDTVPNTFTLGGSGTNCWVKEQLVAQDPGAYSFGKSRCSQKGVVTKKP